MYTINTTVTDACAVTGEGKVIFAAMCKKLQQDYKILFEADEPVTFEISPEGFKYYHCREGKVALGVASKPENVTLNGKKVPSFDYNAEHKTISLLLPAGEGMVTINTQKKGSSSQSDDDFPVLFIPLFM
jgi:hypothetical protein